MNGLSGIALIALVSSVIMTLCEFYFWKKWGMEGTADWQVNSVVVSKFIGKIKEPKKTGLWWIITSQLSHGVAAGVVFWLLFQFFKPVPFTSSMIIFVTVAYSIGLWFLFLVLGRRSFESLGRIRITGQGLMRSLLSLAIYGFFLGLLLSTFH